MVLSMSAEISPALAANPAGAGVGTSNGKPKLYVDFLGDNSGNGGLIDPAGAAAPGNTDWRYSSGGNGVVNQTIFWVGVGIDNIDEFVLANDTGAGTGLSSLELGFYYNSDFVRPYTGAIAGDDSAYLSVLNANNIGSGTNQWSSDYEVAAAVSTVDPSQVRSDMTVNDTATQEYAPPSGWEMTYLSIHKKAGSTGDNRFSDAASGGDTYQDAQYVAMIPFVLTGIDPNAALCFKLALNAFVFSAGGGEDGHTVYGAWEKRTAEDPDHNLKLMLDFTGDLNIFTGGKESTTYQAALALNNGGRVDNKATLGIWQDPAPNPVMISRDGDAITGLLGGVEMELKLECARGFTVDVTVSDASGNIIHTYTFTAAASSAQLETRFTMPDDNVSVTVKFSSSGTGGTSYRATLDIEHVGVEADERNNRATISYIDDNNVGWSVYGDGDILELPDGKLVTVTVELNSEYDVKVEVTRTGDGTTITTGTVTNQEKEKKYTFTMPSADTTVKVTFTKAVHHALTLVVTNDPVSEAHADNKAKLSYTIPEDRDAAGNLISHETDEIYWGALGLTDSLDPRAGRIVTVAIPHYDPAYAVKTVKISPVNLGDFTEFDASMGRTNETYTFSMPKFAAKVTVTFEKMSDFKVRLVIAGDAGSGTAALEAADARGTQTTNVDGGTIAVFLGTTVNVTAVAAAGYTVNIDIRRPNGDPILPSGGMGTWSFSLDTPYVNTSDATTVKVTFRENAAPLYNATLNYEYMSGTTPDARNSTKWKNTNKNPVQAAENTTLVGEINVAPGYYIQSAIAETAIGVVPVTLGGNGYNNGAGTGTTPVTVYLTMPAADVFVRVIYVKGEPPAESGFQAKLVLDGDSGGIASNFNLKNEAGDTAAPGGYVTAEAGSTITGVFGTAPGYYVTGVTVTAATAGVGVDWQWMPGGAISVTMPASHVTVSVKVEELASPPTFDLTLEKQEISTHDDGNAATLGTLSVGSSLSASAMAEAGTPFHLAAQAAPNYTVLAVLLTDASGIHPATLTSGSLGEMSVEADVVMPVGALTVTVIYGTESPPLPGQYALILAVSDPDNDNNAANTAQVYINGTAKLPLAKKDGMAVFYAYPGDDILVETAAATGYSVAGVAVTPGSHGITPVPQGGGNYAFLMPNGDTAATVTFRKGAAPTYTVNLVLRGTGTGTGTLGAYGTTVYSKTVTAGTLITAELFADAGSYIQAVTVTPAVLGVSASYTGAFARQSCSFVMPAADCILNVYLMQGWPGDMDYDATLKVVDPTSTAGNYAVLTNTVSGDATNVLSGTAQETVPGRETNLIKVTVNAVADFVADIAITDGGGNSVAYTRSGSGELTFTMPASPVVVTVRYRHATAADDYTVTLHVVDGSSGDSVAVENLRNGGTIAWPGMSTTLAARPGDAIMVTSIAGDGRYILSSLVMWGGQLMAYQTNSAVATGDYFVMPAGDVDVYVTFTDTEPSSDDYTAALVVTADSATAGSATITDSADLVNYADVLAQSIGQINVTAGGRVQVEAFPNTEAGYHVTDIRLTPAGGSAQSVPFTWIGDSKVEFTMPARNVAVEVVLEQAPMPTYRAQIVVNGTISGVVAGSALLGNSAGDIGTLFTDLTPGSALEAIITVTPGYIISSVLAVPTLPGGDMTPTADVSQSQNISFTMPANDVVIYVNFAVDPTTVYSAELSVTHSSESTAISVDNKASIGTPRRPTLTTANMNTATAAPAAAGERVTVILSPATGFYVDTYSVTDSSGAVITCTATANGFTFLMPAGDVEIEAVFTDQAPAARTLTLHVTDQTGIVDPALKVKMEDLFSVAEWNQGDGDKTLATATGRRITVTADLPIRTYVAAAYAIQGSTVYPFTMSAYWSGTAAGISTGQFYMPAGNVDVYVVLGYSGTPSIGSYAAALMVNGPAGKAIGDAGSATMTLNSSIFAQTITVQSGAVHQYIPAEAGDIFTVTITVNDGYAIDTVVGSQVAVTATGNPNEYTFTMPTGTNVGATVTLKEASTAGRPLKLHVGHTGTDFDANNSASVSYTDTASTSTYTKSVMAGPTGTAVDGLPMVPSNQLVTLTVTPQAGYYVDAAYVLAGTTLVSLSRRLEGTDETTDPANAKATFNMPASAADVYIFYKKGATPSTPWYNVIFMATDVDAAGTPNTGASAAAITVGGVTKTVSSNASAASFTSVVEGELVALQAQPGSGYVLSGRSATPAVTFDQVYDPAVNDYVFVMPSHNVAAVMHFKPDTIGYSATLHLSPNTVSGVTMSATPGNPASVSHDGEVIRSIPTGTVIKTAAPDTENGGLPLHAVLATTSSGGTTFLAKDATDGTWNYTMGTENVNITAAYDDNDPLTPERYVAAVSQSYKQGSIADAGNKAEISNTTTSGLASGMIWTEAQESDNIIVNLTLADGYSAIITAKDANGTVLNLTNGSDTGTQFELAAAGEVSFTMPKGVNVQVSVIFVQGYTVTLSVPGSNPAGSTYSVIAVTGGIPGTPITGDGEKIKGLKGGETIAADVVPGTGYEVSSIVITKASGSEVITKNGTTGTYDYTMPEENIIVTPIVSATPTDPKDKLYIAAVNGTGTMGTGDEITGIENTTDFTLPKGTIWAAGKGTHQMEVSYTTGAGVYAVVTAVDANGNPVPVLQVGVTGTGTAYLVMPEANVQVTVAFSNTPPSGQVTVDLVSTQHGGKQANKSTVTYNGTPYELIPTADDPADVMGQITDAQIGGPLNMKVERDSAYSFKGVELSLTGQTKGPVVPIALNAQHEATILVPTGNVTLTFIYDSTPPTPQPWDPKGTADATVTPSVETGHLTAENGTTPGTVVVTVPVLYGVLAADAAMGYHSVKDDSLTPPFGVEFRFYYKDETTGDFVALEEGVDIGLGTIDNAVTTEISGTTYTSARFDLTGLNDEVKNLITKGGILYITATRTDTMADGTHYPESEKTQLLLPHSAMGRPYDPSNAAVTTGPVLEAGYIYAVNTGDRAEMDIPNLIDSSGALSSAADENLEFNFYVFDGTNYLLLTEDDIVLTRDAPDGIHFILEIKEPTAPATISTAAQHLKSMMDNASSIASDNKTRLFVTATLVDNSDPANPVPGPESDKTEVWLPKYITLWGEFTSYAPTHLATLELRLPLPTATDLSLTESYGASAFSIDVKGEGGSGLWTQSFAFRSSELVSPRSGATSATYMLVIEKTAHITYQRVDVSLDTSTGDSSFEITGTKPIRLIGGDINGDQQTKATDRSILVNYIAYNLDWSYTEDPGDPEWEVSTYNPSSWAYVCDLNGDGYINGADLAILTAEANFNKTAADYGAPFGLDFSPLAAAPAALPLTLPLSDEELDPTQTEAAETEQESAPAAIEAQAPADLAIVPTAPVSKPLIAYPDAILPEEKRE